MSEAAHHTPARRAAVTLTLGLGQTVAFASSYYLMGVLGDAVAADLAVSPTVVFALTSLALGVSPYAAIALSSALCLVMFVMTLGLQAHPNLNKEHAAA